MKAAQVRFDYLVNIYIASQFCLLIFLLSELLEIYLVSRVNIVGFRAGLIRLIFQLRFTLIEAFLNGGFKDLS